MSITTGAIGKMLPCKGFTVLGTAKAGHNEACCAALVPAITAGGPHCEYGRNGRDGKDATSGDRVAALPTERSPHCEPANIDAGLPGNERNVPPRCVLGSGAPVEVMLDAA